MKKLLLVTILSTFLLVGCGMEKEAPKYDYSTYTEFTNLKQNYMIQFPPAWDAMVQEENSNFSVFGPEPLEAQNLIGTVEYVDFEGDIKELMSKLSTEQSFEYTNLEPLNINGFESIVADYSTKELQKGRIYFIQTPDRIYTVKGRTTDAEQLRILDEVAYSFELVSGEIGK